MEHIRVMTILQVVVNSREWKQRKERLTIPEEDEIVDDTENLSTNCEASLSQNQEQASSETSKHSEPTDATVKDKSDEIQTVTESITNMKTEPNSNPASPEPPSQNEPEPSQSIEQANDIPAEASPIHIASDTSNTIEKEDEEDDKPRPPEDDSVPDMEESFTTDGVGHDVDEYINNNISNDELLSKKTLGLEKTRE